MTDGAHMTVAGISPAPTPVRRREALLRAAARGDETWLLAPRADNPIHGLHRTPARMAFPPCDEPQKPMTSTQLVEAAHHDVGSLITGRPRTRSTWLSKVELIHAIGAGASAAHRRRDSATR